MKRTDAAIKYGVNKSTITRIMKLDLNKVTNDNMKRLAPLSKYRDINRKMVPQYHQWLAHGVCVTSNMLQEEGYRQAALLGRTDFAPSAGWERSFRTQYPLVNLIPKGGKVIAATTAPDADLLCDVPAMAELNLYDVQMTDQPLAMNSKAATPVPPDFVITLRDYLEQQRSNPMPLGFVRLLFRQLVKVLLERIANGQAVDGDLNPETILLAISNCGALCITVVDSVESNIIGYGQSYRSPQVLVGQASNRASHVWSLGCILAELLLGRPLYSGLEDENLFLQHVSQIKGFPLLDDLMTQRSAMSSLSGLDRAAELTDIDYCAQLIKRLLIVDPYQRMDLADMLHDPFITLQHLADYESTTYFSQAKAEIVACCTENRELKGTSSGIELVGHEADFGQPTADLKVSENDAACPWMHFPATPQQ
ncbi:hypothetical protein BV898_02818 [Hypsibius exemplaris]|uniref:Protein kinase domain-containing protein n=1 Tax=Hypsibius exemplaris TaxID=2072580 RepID=A0A1W0X7T6_HYPEX|nr:hypothetical protein BV898_02818 [Hypsibius exemplaris]